MDDYLVRYKDMLRDFGVTGRDMSEFLGMTYGSYRAATMPSCAVVPRWVISFVECYDLLEKKSDASRNDVLCVGSIIKK